MEEVTAFAGRGPYHSVPVPLLPLQDAAEKRAWLEPRRPLYRESTLPSVSISTLMAMACVSLVE